jgi:hypothetical protein
LPITTSLLGYFVHPSRENLVILPYFSTPEPPDSPPFGYFALFFKREPRFSEVFLLAMIFFD